MGKRVPLPWSTLKCGMIVTLAGSTVERLITRLEHGHATASDLLFHHEDFIHMEYLDGETWKPLWTEEPGE